MTGMTDLAELLAALSPRLHDGEYVFASAPPGTSLPSCVDPLATVREREGLSLVITAAEARRAGLEGEGSFRLISLEVHSSLHAVGLTAEIAAALAAEGISANVIAGFHHDHLLVPSDRAGEALGVLERLTR
jgi:hypothetical protein